MTSDVNPFTLSAKLEEIQREIQPRVVEADDCAWILPFRGGAGGDPRAGSATGGAAAAGAEAHRRTPSVPLRLVGGMDVSYAPQQGPSSQQEAVAALVVLSLPEMRIVWEGYERLNATAEYAPGLLASREAEPLLALLRRCRSEAPEAAPQARSRGARASAAFRGEFCQRAARTARGLRRPAPGDPGRRLRGPPPAGRGPRVPHRRHRRRADGGLRKDSAAARRLAPRGEAPKADLDPSLTSS